MQIFRLEKRILGEKSLTVGIRCKQFQNTANSDPHPPNARFAATLTRFDCYSIKGGFHVLSLNDAHPQSSHAASKSA